MAEKGDRPERKAEDGCSRAANRSQRSSGEGKAPQRKDDREDCTNPRYQPITCVHTGLIPRRREEQSPSRWNEPGRKPDPEDRSVGEPPGMSPEVV